MSLILVEELDPHKPHSMTKIYIFFLKPKKLIEEQNQPHEQKHNKNNNRNNIAQNDT